MRIPLSALTLATFCLVFSACMKNEAKSSLTQTDSTGLAGHNTLPQVSDSNVTFPAISTIDTVSINTSLAWQATASATWIHLDTTQGTGVYQLKISAGLNYTGNNQTGNVTISFPNNSSTSPITIAVKQNAAPASGWLQLTTASGLTTSNQPGVTYTYNGQLYFGWSTSGDHNIYSLDTTTYKWVAAITIPSGIQVVQQPTYFFIGTKLYIGGGYGPVLNFYEYDLTQGNSAAAWRSLTPLPEVMNNGGGFAIGQYGYAQSGMFNAAGNNMLYQFSTTGSSDPGTWTTLGPLNVEDGPPASFVIGNTVYIGGGSSGAIDMNAANTFYSLTPPSITPAKIALVPEASSISPGQRFTTWVDGNMAYAYDAYSKTLFSYDPASNTWTSISTLPATGLVSYAYEYNGHVYAWDYNGNLWEYIN